MYIVVERDKLLKSIAKVQSVVEKRNILQILEHVKIDITNGSISFITTDMDITIQDSFNLEQDNKISFTVPVQQLYNIIKRLYNCYDLKFDVSNIVSGKLDIFAGSSNFTIPCLSVDEFPSFETIADHVELLIKNVNLRQLFLKTRHAMSSGETRYYLNGIYVHTMASDSKKLIATATDVHRLALASINLESEVDLINGIIVPHKTVNEIIKLTESVSNDYLVPIAIGENKIQMIFDTTILTSRLVNGKYPSYTSIFSIKQDKKFSVDVKELTNAIELVLTVAEGKTKVVKLHLQGNRLIISVDNNGRGATAMQELDVDTYLIDGDGNDVSVMENSNGTIDITVLLNAKYLLDVLNVSIGPRIHFNILSTTTPIVIKDTADQDCMYVLMPMQLEGTT